MSAEAIAESGRLALAQEIAAFIEGTGTEREKRRAGILAGMLFGGASAFECAVFCGWPRDSHESDLYLPNTRTVKRLLDYFPLQKANATTFIVQKGHPNAGQSWRDIPFAYLPHWIRRCGMPEETPAPETPGVPLEKGERILIRPQWQDEGDASFLWFTSDPEEKGRVSVSPDGGGIPMIQTVEASHVRRVYPVLMGGGS